MTADMMPDSNNASRNFSLLSLTGKDGKRFLQGQLSCDMEQLEAGKMLRGTLCNLKGRVIASLWIWQQEDVIYLRAGKDMAKLLTDSLNKYIVFFDCQFKDISDQYQLWQVADGEPAEQPGLVNSVMAQNGHFVLGLDQTRRIGRRYEVFVPTGNTPESILAELSSAQPSSSFEPVSPQTWALADTETGWVMIHPAISEKYTPQLLNFDLDGTVNFKKGCYTGQEVIARMHYRAEAKQRLYRLQRPVDTSIADYGISKEDNIVFSADLNDEEKIELLIASTDDSKRHPDIQAISGAVSAA